MSAEKMQFLFVVLLMLQVFSVVYLDGCMKKDYGKGSFVCVCNEKFCDTVVPNTRLKLGYLAHYKTSAAEFRLYKKVLKFDPNTTDSYTYMIRRDKTFQTVIGFGGAFTDAAGINILQLPPQIQDKLISSYYGPSGIEYTVGRIPMASCDFSTHPYSYDDNPGDFNLTKFSLAPEDFKFKIPVIKKALSVSRRTISIFGSPWSAPAWMKTNKNMTGKGSLIGQAGDAYHKTWANYFVRFLQEYGKHNIKLWGLTAQNEPTDGKLAKFPFQAMGWTPEQQRDFIVQDLGPALHKNGFSDVKLMILDDTRLMLPYWANVVFSNPAAKKYISGIGVHWYEDPFLPTTPLDLTHQLYPKLFILATEACEGSTFWEPDKVALGSWKRAQTYIHSIIQDMSHWVTGWVDWNIALNIEGGPNWVKNFVDSPVIVNASAGEFYKQPMFYAMGHFSKFIVPGSKRAWLDVSHNQANLESVAFVLPDDSVAIVVHNKGDSTIAVSIQDHSQGHISLQLEPFSIHTFIWWKS